MENKIEKNMESYQKLVWSEKKFEKQTRGKDKSENPVCEQHIWWNLKRTNLETDGKQIWELWWKTNSKTCSNTN